MLVAGLEYLQRWCMLPRSAMLPSKGELSRNLDTLLPVIQRTNLLLVLQGRFLYSCSSQSRAMLPSKRKLSCDLDTLFIRQRVQDRVPRQTRCSQEVPRAYAQYAEP